MNHAAETGHSFREKDLIVLDSDDNWKERGIRESIYIRALNPSLNRERNDRYSLPATYDSIIKDTIKPPPTPLPHQPSERKTYTGDRRHGRQRREMEITPAAATTTTTATTFAKTVIPPSGHHMLTRRMARASAGDGDTPD